MKFIKFLILAFVCAACGSAEDEPDLFTNTYRDYPDGGSTLEIGEVEQAITTFGFFGIRSDTGGIGRGSLCTGNSDAQQICWLPASKNVRYYVNPANFSAADLQEINTGITNHLFFWGPDWFDYSGPATNPSDLGWTVQAGTAQSHNVQIKAAGVASIYPQGDSRHWIQLGCESSTTLTENPALTGQWKRCDKFVFTIDVNKIVDDGQSAARASRLRQTAGQALGAGHGMGVTHINPGTVFQTTAAGNSSLVYDLTNRNACALHLFNASSTSTVTKLASTACDGWQWPE
jgi:hypothetical protein